MSPVRTCSQGGEPSTPLSNGNAWFWTAALRGDETGVGCEARIDSKTSTTSPNSGSGGGKGAADARGEDGLGTVFMSGGSAPMFTCTETATAGAASGCDGEGAMAGATCRGAERSGAEWRGAERSGAEWRGAERSG